MQVQSGVAGSIHQEKDFVSSHKRLHGVGTLKVAVRNLTISGLDSLVSMSLLDVTGDYSLLNSLRLGYPNPVNFAVNLEVRHFRSGCNTCVTLQLLPIRVNPASYLDA